MPNSQKGFSVIIIVLIFLVILTAIVGASFYFKSTLLTSKVSTPVIKQETVVSTPVIKQETVDKLKDFDPKNESKDFYLPNGQATNKMFYLKANNIGTRLE